MPPVTRSARTDSIRRRGAKTRPLTKRSCVSPVSHRFVRTASCPRRACKFTIPHRRRASPGEYSGFWPGPGDPLRGQHFAHYWSAASTVWISQYGRNRYSHKERRRFSNRATQPSTAKYDTIMPSFEYGGVAAKLNYYFTGSYLHNGIGIENPTGTANPIKTTRINIRMFGYSSYIHRRHQPIRAAH